MTTAGNVVDPDALRWATDVTLIYRAVSGEVLLDTGGGHFTSFLLKSAGLFRHEEFTPFLDVPLVTSNENTVALFADAIEPGQLTPQLHNNLLRELV